MFGKTNVYLGDDAKLKMIEGVNLLAEAVGSTLGPLGNNVIVEQNLGFFVTKDGVTVAKNVDPVDSLQALGANLVKQASLKTNTNAGDGTTSSVVFAQVLINEGYKFLKENPKYSAVQFKKEMESAFDAVKSYIDTHKIDIRGNYEKLKQVAAISANNDEELGSLIADAYSKVGELGVVTVEDSKTFETTVHITEGMSFDKGYVSPYFVTDPVKMTVEYKDAFIFLYDGKIVNIKHLMGILDAVRKEGKPILLIAEDFDSQTISTLAVNKWKVNFPVVAVKSPGFGNLTKEYLHDIAAMTGATVISDMEGKPLESISLLDLGRAKQIKVTKTETSIVNGLGEKEFLEERINLLKSHLQNESRSWQKEKLEERLAKLTSGVAIIKVGAVTESELQEKKYRLEDALAAVKAALKEGVVEGGGICLYNAQQELNIDKLPFKSGYSIVIDNLTAGLRKICQNAGLNPDDIINGFNAKQKGFNVKTGKYVKSMFEEGIVDPALVNEEALRNAISVAGMLLTTGAALTKVEKVEMSNMGEYDPDMIAPE